MKIKITQINSEEVFPIIEGAGLPVSDIEPEFSVFLAATTQDKIVGCAGIQQIGKYGLLRSLVVLPVYRGEGIAKKLCDSILDLAKKKKYQTVYLLTTDAERYFSKYGFNKIEKESAPEAVKLTRQYREICSDSAVVMKMEL